MNPLSCMMIRSISIEEDRYYSLGVTNEYRHLTIIFTMRDQKIRPLSARPMTKSEVKYYEDIKKGSLSSSQKLKSQSSGSKHDLTDYFDLSKAKKVKFPNLKPSTKLISIRLPESLIEDLKILSKS